MRENRLLRNLAQSAALAAAFGGLFAIFGWIFAVPFFSSFAGGFIPMAPSTAFLFMLLGSLIFLHSRFPENGTIYMTGLAAGALSIVASLLLFYYSTANIHLPIELLGVTARQTIKDGVPAGYMSPLTAICFTVLSVSFVFTLISSGRRLEYAVLTFYLAYFIALLAMVLLVAYLIGKPVMYGSGLIPPAMPTALAFIFLSLAIIISASLHIWPAGIHLRVVLSTLPPLAAFILQWLFWPFLHPLLWFLFYPAVFFSAWLGGISGGLSATLISTALVVFFFIPPEISFAIEYPKYIFSILIFIGMGTLFGYMQENLRKAKQKIAEALDAVKAANEQLEASNRELESFSYSVSHDLRAPLRAVTGFSHKLQKLFEDKLDEEGNRLIQVIVDNGKKMGQLIDDLLTFSRMSRKEMNHSYVNMEILAQETFKEIISTLKGRSFNFELHKLTPVYGDPALIKQVFYNLLSNAVKFSRNKKQAVVEVGCETHGEEHVYYVKDNGAGFNMQYADKLFGVFQRLHSENEFEGTGIGLSLVQRIIHKHGGAVWAKGEPDKGAVFYFTLPSGETVR